MLFTTPASATGTAVGNPCPRPGRAETRVFATALVAVATTLFLSCGDAGTDPAVPPAPVATTVSVTPASAALAAIGETIQFTAEVRDQNGQAMAGAPVVWSSSDASVAPVDPSGVATAASNGSATITAISGAASGSAMVTVEQEVAAVVVSPDSAALLVGDTVRLSATVLDALGVEVVGAEVSWSSADTLVATVDAAGLAMGRGLGEVTITATSGTVPGTATVRVEQSAAAVVVSPGSVALLVGDTVRLSATVLDVLGGVVLGAEVVWSSGDTLVAMVGAAGLTMGRGPGETEITATSGAASGTAAVRVEQSAALVAVSPDSVALVVGDTARLSATVLDALGVEVEGAEVSWSSADTLVATVDAAGLATGRGPGETEITATSGSASGTAAVRVEQSAAAVAVSPDSAALLVGDTVRLSATVLDALGVEVVGAEVSWSSGDTLVATVDASGLATGIGAGEVEVTAASAGVEGRARMVVAVAAPTTVTVTPDSASLTALGDTVRLSAEVFDQVGRSMPGAAVAWSSGDPTVASVDSAGLVRAQGSGAATVTASSGSASGSASVSVMQSASSVVVTPAEADIGLGDTLRLAAEALDANGNAVAGAEFSWSSSDPAVVSVDGSGLVRGVAEGAATVTAGAGDAEGTSKVTVANPDRAALEALYNATDGPNWVNNENWLTDAPLGEWYGVHTDHAGRVARLDLGGSRDESGEWIRHGLAGPLPPELGKLTELTRLRLDHNELTGTIPSELADLPRLTVLHIGPNSLHGPIPSELGNLASLTRLDLFGNRLTGPIPPELGNLANLEHLLLGTNTYTGLIPSELGNLTRLRVLDLSGNRLTGPLPPQIGNLAELTGLHLGNNLLTGPIPPQIGDLAKLTTLRLFGNRLEGHIPPSLGNLTELRNFDVGGNELEGPVPAELGGLTSLVNLRLWGNRALSGSLPATLTRLTSLRELSIEDTGLCVPGTTSFRTWLRGLEVVRGENCAENDMAVLRSLYEATAGVGWNESSGWLDDEALDGWYGVTTDSTGRVVALDLSRNGLAGRLPSQLGELAQLTELRIEDNIELDGRLPSSLSSLSLQTLHYAGTGLCIPVETFFRDWVSAIPSHEGTGVECAPLSDREILERFYYATGGPNWIYQDGWLTDMPLGEWYGVEVDHRGRVIGIRLGDNQLSGTIPPELESLTTLVRLDLGGNEVSISPEIGNLVNLRSLYLSRTNLSGTIPPELGNLHNLEILYLSRNRRLSGPIPPELGNLGSLRSLWLDSNQLSGPIPPELGNLKNLRELILFENHLSGTMPSELGDLDNLRRLSVYSNELSGPIPSRLGELARLEELLVSFNQLSGPIPRELGSLDRLSRLYLNYNDLEGPVPSRFRGMSSLQELSLASNPRMKGSLPAGLTALRELDALFADGTGLCAPSDQGFQTWLASLGRQRVPTCGREAFSAYLTQAIQSRTFPVPLVSGREALLRVFPTSGNTTGVGIPKVRARFYRYGREVHVVDIPAKPTPVPTEVNEGDLSQSANAMIPGRIVQPGLEMVIEVDPDGTLDPKLGIVRRIPDSGRLATDVHDMPVFDLTVIPFVWNETGDSSIVDVVGAMAADPENHEMLQEAYTLLPIGDMDVKAHEPVLTSTNDVDALGGETVAIRTIEGGTGYYMGMMSEPVTGGGGVARRSHLSNFSRSKDHIIAHEIGHTFSLSHVPCGNPLAVDPGYPYPDGSIGAWGYDSRNGRLVHPSIPDVMSYCRNPHWISDYSFTTALHFRLKTESASQRTSQQAPAEALLLWGGINSEGDPFLEPAFVIDAPAALPPSAGDYRLVGRTHDETEIFFLSFDMPEVADGDGSSSFVFVLPVRPGWERDLASITLSGPGGPVTLDGESDLPMAILRNPQTGQVRGILRQPPPAFQATASAAGQVTGSQFEVLFSRGIPETSAWRR